MPHSPSFPQHCGGAARASPVCMPAMTLGRRDSSIWHTHTHQTRCPRRCVHGALKRGDCERVRPCLAPAPPQSRPSAAPSFLAMQAQTLLDRPICYSCRKLSAFAPVGRTGARFGSGPRVRAPIAREPGHSARGGPRLRTHRKHRVHTAGLHAALRTGGGAGGHWSPPRHLAQHASVHASPGPRPHNPSGRSGLMVEDWARITSGALLPPSSPAPSLFPPPPPLLARWSCLGHWS